MDVNLNLKIDIIVIETRFVQAIFQSIDVILFVFAVSFANDDAHRKMTIQLD